MIICPNSNNKQDTDAVFEAYAQDFTSPCKNCPYLQYENGIMTCTYCNEEK